MFILLLQRERKSLLLLSMFVSLAHAASVLYHDREDDNDDIAAFPDQREKPKSFISMVGRVYSPRGRKI